MWLWPTSRFPAGDPANPQPSVSRRVKFIGVAGELERHSATSKVMTLADVMPVGRECCRRDLDYRFGAVAGAVEVDHLVDEFGGDGLAESEAECLIPVVRRVIAHREHDAATDACRRYA